MDWFKALVIGIVGLGVAFLTVVLIVIGLWVSANNAEVGARNAVLAQQRVNESSYDKLWKVISQTAQVPETERETFKSTYVGIMQATKGVAGEGKLASFFTQAKISIPSSLFKKLMTIIESQRESFHRDQTHLLQLSMQHNNVIEKWPSGLFVGGRPKIEVKIVTSTRTDEAFNSGKDDDVKLFTK